VSQLAINLIAQNYIMAECDTFGLYIHRMIHLRLAVKLGRNGKLSGLYLVGAPFESLPGRKDNSD
jgi:hypothetical protein